MILCLLILPLFPLFSWNRPACEAATLAKTAPEGMVLVPGGEFSMGSVKAVVAKAAKKAGARPEWFADEWTLKKVSVKPFFMDVHEVSNRQYHTFDPKYEFSEGVADHPVVFVTWQKADAFCRKAGKRLPTEAEWEKAARGTDGRVYPWGNTFDPERANFLNSGQGGTSRVGSFKLSSSGSAGKPGTSPVTAFKNGKSVYGIYNMAGNVWEWVSGWYDQKKKFRILKGGSWMSPAISLRSSARLSEFPATQTNEYGFRCAKDTGDSH